MHVQDVNQSFTHLQIEASNGECSPIKSIDSSSSQETLVDVASHSFERALGDTELSYFLPSRESGVNDMYLHLGCRAPVRLVKRERVCVVWAILRLRHPLLASVIKMHDYDDVRFVYMAPRTVEHALNLADLNLEYQTQTKDELIDSYLNGPRTLSNDRLSYLIVSSPSMHKSATDSVETIENCEFLICGTHFGGDGMSLHQFANSFFGLLGSSLTMSDLTMLLSDEWRARCAKVDDPAAALPISLEDRLPIRDGKFRQIVGRVDFERSQEKIIGGHSFPRKSGGSRRTVVPTVSFDPDRTKKILKNCKARGVTISSAVFALCNIAWTKTCGQKKEMPTMMYSALNLRPFFVANKALNDSYWYLAIGYFNIVLPAFLPGSGDISAIFWHRARSVKKQSDAAKNPMTVSRSRQMARERGARAKVWAKEDDDKAKGVWQAPPAPSTKLPERPPSTALIGLSLLGNLDGMYKHSSFSDIELHTLTTGSRQRSGGMLLFGYTFVGKFWLSLGYDENGFDTEVVDKFWHNLLNCTDEYLVN